MLTRKIVEVTANKRLPVWLLPKSPALLAHTFQVAAVAEALNLVTEVNFLEFRFEIMKFR